MLINDKWGTRPIFYIIQNQQLVSSENIDNLLQKLPEASLNPKGIARFLIQDFSHPTETLFNEIKKVPPGHQVQLKNLTIEEKKVVDLDFFYHSKTLEELCLKWTSILKNNLLRILQKNEKCGVFISGGLDSCGLAALSAQLIRDHQLDCKLELYHVQTTNSESYDQGFVKKISQQFKLPVYCETLTPEYLAKDFSRWKETKSAIPFFPTLQMFSPLMKKAKENNCQTVLFGYGADEQWTFSPSTISQLKYNIKKILPSLIRKFWQQSKKSTFRSEQRIDLDQRIDRTDSLFSNLTQKQLYLRNYFSGNNTHNFACHISLAAAYGLSVQFPYLCSDLLDLSFSTPPDLFSKMQDKILLRQAFKGLLDDSIRLAPKFQDYSHLAYKTALQIQKESKEYLNKPYQAVFDDDSFFEGCFIEKISKQYRGCDYEKIRFN